MPPRRPNPRKLLVASVGVATLNYLGSACSDSKTATVANLLVGPPLDAGHDAARDSGKHQPEASPTVANLMAPAPLPTGKQR